MQPKAKHGDLGSKEDKQAGQFPRWETSWEKNKVANVASTESEVKETYKTSQRTRQSQVV